MVIFILVSLKFFGKGFLNSFLIIDVMLIVIISNRINLFVNV